MGYNPNGGGFGSSVLNYILKNVGEIASDTLKTKVNDYLGNSREAKIGAILAKGGNPPNEQEPLIQNNAVTPDGFSVFRDAIKQQESNGNYNAIGPRTNDGDNAYGAYQVIGKNIPLWTQETLGRKMTPQEFLADKAAQDAVFDKYGGEYYKKYGTEGAARAWFGGEGSVNGPGEAADVTGKTVKNYGKDILRRVGVSENNPQTQYSNYAELLLKNGYIEEGKALEELNLKKQAQKNAATREDEQMGLTKFDVYNRARRDDQELDLKRQELGLKSKELNGKDAIDNKFVVEHFAADPTIKELEGAEGAFRDFRSIAEPYSKAPYSADGSVNFRSMANRIVDDPATVGELVILAHKMLLPKEAVMPSDIAAQQGLSEAGSYINKISTIFAGNPKASLSPEVVNGLLIRMDQLDKLRERRISEVIEGMGRMDPQAIEMITQINPFLGSRLLKRNGQNADPKASIAKRRGVE